MLEEFAAVKVALAQRVADAKFLAKGRRNAGGAVDDDDMLATEAIVDTVPAVFHLTYEDRSRELSARVVTIRRIENRRGSYYLHGFCHMRRAPRCFAVDRIVECFDVTTGECFGDAATFFATHPLYTDPRDPEQQAIRLCCHELNILTVVGACDGLFDPDEQDVVLRHVFDRADHLVLDEGVLRASLALVAPDRAAFDGALWQMGRFRAGDSIALRRSLRKLVDVDGVLDAAEVNFVYEIEDRLELNR